jgi:hypothetical protein
MLEQISISATRDVVVCHIRHFTTSGFRDDYTLNNSCAATKVIIRGALPRAEFQNDVVRQFQGSSFQSTGGFLVERAAPPRTPQLESRREGHSEPIVIG